MSFLQILHGILEGFRVTALVTLLGMLYAVPFAFVAGVTQHCSKGWLRAATTAVIEFWRSTPVIILLYAFYYMLPGFGIRLPGLVVASLVLGLNIGGYGSQAVRAALQTLDRGQEEAGRALGLRPWQVLLKVELPQALVAMMPTFVNQFIQLVKGTALVSLITLDDMTFKAKEIAQLTYDPVSVYSGLLVAYFILCYPATIVGRWLEKLVGAGQRPVHDV
ncbi:MAG TPA: amino acid ABC transporter permease [Aliidongia sp.]|uniref:amino acid ABC transporter permease n=1 Tax=Aliidongia sp. TaxID=1914230 RepID=UPI002DDCCF37|nr:amino acid ABC transporter permease [Aliidongia sp.]HEV2674721.1 amino acid ABC transporter permease [Aliidongia sp.]